MFLDITQITLFHNYIENLGIWGGGEDMSVPCPPGTTTVSIKYLLTVFIITKCHDQVTFYLALSLLSIAGMTNVLHQERNKQSTNKDIQCF